MLKSLARIGRWLLMAGGVFLCLGAVFFLVVVRPQLAARLGGTATNAAYIERRTLDDVLNVSGTLRPIQTVNVNFDTAGKVATVVVRAGDAVAVGDTLATLDEAALTRSLEQARLSRTIQQANYDTTIRPATADQIARAKATLAQAEAALAQAQAQFDNQRNAITTSCTNVGSLTQALMTAEQAYKNYLTDGFQFDSEFRPDANSPAGRALKSARDQMEVGQATCDSAKRAQSGDASVVSAQAGVEQAKVALDTLLRGATPEQIAIAEAQLAQAKLNVSAAEENLTDAVLKSPVKGIIAAVNITAGGTVGSSGGAAGAAFVIADTSSIYLETLVDENDISRVVGELPVRFTLQGLPFDQVFNGTVESKSAVGQNNQGVIAYPVRIALKGDVPLFLNMSADVEIILATRENVLVVATRAIRRGADGGRFILIERSDGTTTEISVEIGLSADSVTEISGEGLREGQKVLIEGRTGAGN